MQDYPDWGKPIRPTLFTPTGSGARVLAGATREALRGSVTPSAVCIVKARKANTGTVYMGTVAVTADESAATGGMQLEPGDAITFSGSDLGAVYIIGTAGDGVSFMWWV